MRTWLAKFRVSTALDSGEPLSAKLRQKIAADAELQNFVRRADALGRALKHQPPPAGPPLHESIMRAVRESARRGQTRRAPVSIWLYVSPAVAAVAAVACVSLWLAFHRAAPKGAGSLDGPALVLQMSEEMPKTMPMAVLAPLSNEWARVDRDVRNTTQVLLASFP
jgi:hypothetical protein